MCMRMLGYHSKRPSFCCRKPLFTELNNSRTIFAPPYQHFTEVCISGQPATGKDCRPPASHESGLPTINGALPATCQPWIVACRPLMHRSILLQQRTDRAKWGYSHRLFAQFTPLFHEQIRGVENLSYKPPTQTISLHDDLWFKMCKLNKCNTRHTKPSPYHAWSREMET